MSKYRFEVEFDYDRADILAVGFAQAMTEVLNDLNCGDTLVKLSIVTEEEA